MASMTEKVTDKKLAKLLGWVKERRPFGWWIAPPNAYIKGSNHCPAFTKSLDILASEMKRIKMPWSWASNGDIKVGLYDECAMGQEPADAISRLLYFQLVVEPIPVPPMVGRWSPRSRPEVKRGSPGGYRPRPKRMRTA